MFDSIRTKIGTAIIGKSATVLTPQSLGMQTGGYAFGFNSIESAYDKSWAAYACIRRIAQDLAGVPLVCLSDPNDPESVLPDSHPLPTLIRQPNEMFSQYEFVQWIGTMLNLRGEYFVVMDNPIRPTRLIQYTDPLFWREIKEGRKVIGWEYRYNGDEIIATESDLIRHRLIDPSRPNRGQAPLRAAAVAYQIDTGSDEMQADLVRRGGEKSIIYESTRNLTSPQESQAVARLQARRVANRIGKDVILPAGLKPVQPGFADTDMKIIQSHKVQPDHICAVFGVAKSLIGFEDIDKYATFAGRIRVYWESTLIPMIHGIESSFDKTFTSDTISRTYNGYVRFDLSKVKALRDDLSDVFKIAGELHKNGVPWSVINERLNLGLDTEGIPGSDTFFIPSSQAPADAVLEEWRTGPPSPPATPAKGGAGAPTTKELTNDLIRTRATDPRGLIRRHSKIMRLEKSLRAEWKKIIGSAMLKAEKGGATVAAVEKLKDPTIKKIVSTLEAFHVEASKIGAQSIVELVTGKMTDFDEAVYTKAAGLRPDVRAWVEERKKLTTTMGEQLFGDVLDAMKAEIRLQGSQTDLVRVMRKRFHSAPGGINKAIVVARTEIGSAVNNSRFVETKEQGFEEHEWLTAGDEAVRTDDFDHASCDGEVRKVGDKFPCGLAYPMEAGGEPGNVINCRCETIPVLKKT